MPLLANVSANPGKVHFEVFVHLLRYIRDKNNLGLKYIADINDAPVTDLLRQSSIKTENHLMVILVVNIFQPVAEIQEHTLYFIKVGQSTMAHVFQGLFLNQVHK